HDDLVSTPIPDAKNRRAEKDAGPWKVRIGDRFNHVEVVGRHHRAEMFQAADASQADDRQGNSAGNQDESLNGVGINDGGQAAGDSVNSGGNDQNDRGLPQRPASNTLKNHASRIELHGDFGEDVGDDGDSREIDGGRSIEAPLQEFRHREDVATQVEGYENPPENQQDQAGQPLEMTHSQAGRRACARE